MIEYVLRFSDRDETRLADHNGHVVGDAITIAGRDWVVESISVPAQGSISERIALRPVSPPRDRDTPAGNDQALLHALTERMQDSSDGFTVVMPVSEWIGARLWPASQRAAAED